MIPNQNKNGEICSICGKRFYGYGNNARPLNTGRCCDNCNIGLVIPMRLYILDKYKTNAYNEYLITISYDKEQA